MVQYVNIKVPHLCASPTHWYRPKQHSMWAPVGPRLGPTGAHLGMLLGDHRRCY